MGVTSSQFVSKNENETKMPIHPQILTNHQFSRMDWVVARKSESVEKSKLTFHRRLGADVLPDEDLIQQMSQELICPTYRYWTKQTVHNLFVISHDGSRKMDCRYLSIVLLSNYILRYDKISSHTVEDIYGKEELEDFCDSMIRSVTYRYTTIPIPEHISDNIPHFVDGIELIQDH